MADIRTDETAPGQPLGVHVIADLYGCERPGILDAADRLLRVAEKAAVQAGATVLGSRVEQFVPQGVSGVVLIAESHLSFHTWPEHGFVSLDVFTCGVRVMPDQALEIIMAHLKPQRVQITTLECGGQLHGAPDAD